MQEGLCRIIWTTNFDKVIEDGAATVLGSTGRLVVADLAEPEKARQAIQQHRWPLLGKIHGDFHSERLKNTVAELQQQDSQMRGTLIEACKSQGLLLIGY